MNQSTSENTQQQNTIQQTNTSQVMPQNASPAKIEPEPEIKSEENKANWKAFREQREAERKAKEEALRRAEEKAKEAEALKAALEAITNNKSTKLVDNGRNQYSEDIEESEEQRIDKRVNQILSEREAIAEKERHERERQEFPQKLASTYTDFHKVCSTENLDYLEYHYPEVAAPYRHLPDGFDKWSSIYKAVKRFVPNIDSKQDQQKVEKNLAKPGSISTPGVTQGTGAMPSTRLTEERKKANWERMQRVMNGLSS